MGAGVEACDRAGRHLSGHSHADQRLLGRRDLAVAGAAEHLASPRHQPVPEVEAAEVVAVEQKQYLPQS